MLILKFKCFLKITVLLQREEYELILAILPLVTFLIKKCKILVYYITHICYYLRKGLISGNTNNLVSYPEIKRGVHILGDINITVVNANNKIMPNMQNLDSCSVIVFPSLNPDHEEIQVDGDESLSSTLDIKTNINKDGVEMVGNDAIENYLDVLKALLYSNKKPAYYLNRVFKLACTQLNSEFKNQEFTLTLTVLHPKLAPKTTTTTASIFGVTEHSPYEISGGAVGSTSPGKLNYG